MDFRIDHPFTVITSEPSEPWTTLAEAIELGVTVFVVDEGAIMRFLDSYIPLHDEAMFRRPEKYALFVLYSEGEKADDMVRNIQQHPTILEIVHLLIIRPDKGSFDLLTHRYVGNIPESLDILRLDTFLSESLTFEEGANLFPNKLENLMGKTIKLAAFFLLPWIMMRQDDDGLVYYLNDKYTIDGLDGYVVIEFCKWINCTWDLKAEQNNLQYGRVFENRTGEGMMGSLVIREVDFAISAVGTWWQLFAYFSFTGPIQWLGITCLTPKPKLMPSWRIIFMMFTKTVWGMVILAFVVFSLFEYFLPSNFDGRPKRRSLSLSFMNVFAAILLLPASTMRSGRVSEMILSTTVLLFSLLVAYVYIGKIHSILAVPVFLAPIDTVEELANSKMHWNAPHEAWMYMIETSENPYIKMLLKTFRVIPRPSLKLLADVGEEPIVMAPMLNGHYMVGDWLTSENIENYRAMSELLYYEYDTGYATKTWPLLDSFDYIMMWIRDACLFRYVEQTDVFRYMNIRVQISIQHSRDKQPNKMEAMEVEEIAGGLLMLGLGSVTSFVVFILECIFKRLQRIRYAKKFASVWMKRSLNGKKVEKAMLESTGNSTNDQLWLGVSTVLNLIVVQYFEHLHSTCFFYNASDGDIFGGFNSPHPSIWMDLTAVEDKTLLSSIENGCQGFVLTQDASLSFLDRYNFLHDRTIQRYPAKRFVFLPDLEKADSVDITAILEHDAVHDMPNLLIVFPVEPNRIELITNRFSDIQNFNEPILLDWFDPGNDTFAYGFDLFPDKINDLRGRYLKLAIFNYSPYTRWNMVNSSEESNADYGHDAILAIDGTENLLVLEFCERYNCTLEISLDEEGEWGEIYDNRTGNGIIGAVVERRADIGVGALYSWYHEFTFLSLSKPISRSGITCITPKPKQLSSWMIPILPFASTLWLAVFVTFVLVGFIATALNYMVLNVIKRQKRRIDVCETYMIVGSIFILQTVLIRLNRNNFVSQMILVGSLLFVGLMVGNAYSGGLSSIMTIPRYENPIDTVQDLADSDMHWASTHDAWIFSILMATQPMILKLLDNFRTYPKEVLHGHTKQQDLAYSIERLPYGHFAIGEYIDEEASTEFHLMMEDIYWENCVIMSSKTWPMMKQLDYLILWIFQTGIQRQWEHRVVSKFDNNKVQLAIATSRHMHNDGPVRLQPSHLLGAFLMLAIGLVGGILVFFIECVVEISRPRKINDNRKRLFTKSESFP
ncbi:uncharacterized protein LOC129753122 [Uranotaenia lowii]|uniref:uncharacterized protein LOC129753122 n=1 Tax=Uranotaenia lowii TaxID=190385 RepID=UPI002478BBC7|nr:uncharacterized protein LOC129753122 [Uranotaenia lowii]